MSGSEPVQSETKGSAEWRGSWAYEERTSLEDKLRGSQERNAKLGEELTTAHNEN